MTDAVATGTGFRLWQHETGVNEVATSGVASPVISFFETSEMSLIAAPQEVQNKTVQITFMENDFVQEGNLEVTVAGRANARAAIVERATRTLTPVATTSDEELLVFKEMVRLLRFKFLSNAVDGDYQMGKVLGHLKPGDGRMTT